MFACDWMDLNHRRAFQPAALPAELQPHKILGLQRPIANSVRLEPRIIDMKGIFMPLSGWYLAQPLPDLTANDPSHTRLVRKKGLEPSLN